ncbi:MAG TPA: hypothetical protein VF223_12630 [Trebonia sp.]
MDIYTTFAAAGFAAALLASSQRFRGLAMPAAVAVSLVVITLAAAASAMLQIVSPY